MEDFGQVLTILTSSGGISNLCVIVQRLFLYTKFFKIIKLMQITAFYFDLFKKFQMMKIWFSLCISRKQLVLSSVRSTPVCIQLIWTFRSILQANDTLLQLFQYCRFPFFRIMIFAIERNSIYGISKPNLKKITKWGSSKSTA